VLVLALASVALLAAPPAHGPVLFALSPGHGVDLGDIAALTLGALAARVALPLLDPHRDRLGPVASSTAALAGLGLSLLAVSLLDVTGVADGLGVAYRAAAALVVVAAVAWTLTSAVLDPVPWPATAPVQMATGGAVLLGGLLVDAAMAPSGTLFSTAAVACLVALRATRPAARLAFGGMALAMVVVSVASLADIDGVDVEMSRSAGGVARTIALAGVVLTGTAIELLVRGPLGRSSAIRG
jgi:hypothetical protein